MPSLLVINLHGLINVPDGKKRALRELGIDKRFSATVVVDDSTTLGTLKHCKEYIAWGPIDSELLSELLRRRGKRSLRRRLDEASLKKLGYGTFDELASKIINDRMRLSNVEDARPHFALSPPRGGFKRSSRRQYNDGGILGENPDLPKIVRRMI